MALGGRLVAVAEIAPELLIASILLSAPNATGYSEIVYFTNDRFILPHHSNRDNNFLDPIKRYYPVPQQ